MNALEIRQALDQPADTVVHGEPGLVCRWMPVAAAPAAYGFFETWGKAAFATALAAAPISLAGARMSLRYVISGWSGILFSQLLGF